MKIYIDLGAHRGKIFKKHYETESFDQYHLFEPNKEIYEKYIFPLSKDNVYVYKEAAWTCNKKVNFYIGARWAGEGSTLLENKITGNVDYSNPELVHAIDISQFISGIYNNGDKVYLKMDVEGAEYEILEHMFEQDTLRLIETLEIEFHQHKFKDDLKQRHDKIIERLETLETKVIINTI